MLHKKAKTEIVDRESRLVLKNTETSEHPYKNRKLAVNNFIFGCEKKRENWDGIIFDSPFQIQGVRWDKIKKEWDFSLVTEAKEHAKKHSRFFIINKQRNQEQWEGLKWSYSEDDFMENVEGQRFVPYYLPINSKLEDWLKRKKDAVSVLNKTQKIFPVISSIHDIKHFPIIVEHEISKNSIFGVNCYTLSKIAEISNLAKLRKFNITTKPNEETATIVGFYSNRILTNHSNVASSFAFSLFGMDILNENAWFIEGKPKEALNGIRNRNPEDLYFYDNKEKYFNKSKQQKVWHGIDITKSFLHNTSLEHGLNWYNAIKWKCYQMQQDDLLNLNRIIMKKVGVVDYLKDYSRWSTLWDKTIKPSFVYEV